jgi:hypothetical protein
VAFVNEGNGFEDFGMNAGVIVAGEAAEGLHRQSNVAECPMGLVVEPAFTDGGKRSL